MDPVLNKTADKLIPISEPWLGRQEALALTETIKDNWISQGPKVKEFEAAIAKVTHKTYGSACNSGTTALHLALHVCDVGPGDEVIIPDLTMIALANAVLLTGATPVFVDSNYKSEVGNLGLDNISRAITNKTKAVIVVHTYGEPVQDIKAIKDHCSRLSIKLIEDCAEALFGRLDNQCLGSFGHLSVFSFYSNKNITTGEGGMVTTDSLEVKERLDRVRMHAFTPGKHFCHTERAFGYRMTDMQAAIGLAQLGRASEFMFRRKEIRQMYDEAINRDQIGLGFFKVPPTTDSSAYWVMPLCTYLPRTRDKLREHLAYHGIDTRTYFQPMHKQVFLKKYANPNDGYLWSRYLADRGLYIPLYPKLKDEDINYIIDAIGSYNEN